MAIEVKRYPHANSDAVTYGATISLADTINEYAVTAIVDRICGLIAEKFVEDHYAEIAAKLDPQAIANLAIAESAKKIAEEIRSRPVVYKEKTTHIHNSIF